MWQDAWEKRREEADDLKIVTVAMDAQGWPRAGRFVDEAGLTLPAAVDRDGELWRRYDFNVVPLQLYFDETGRLIYRSVGAPAGEVLERLDEALARPRVEARAALPAPTGDDESEDGATRAQRLFAKGVAKLDAGDPLAARALWAQALALDDDNWLIRKQVWALENPERFYDGDIDRGWQREVLAAERAAEAERGEQ